MQGLGASSLLPAGGSTYPTRETGAEGAARTGWESGEREAVGRRVRESRRALRGRGGWGRSAWGRSLSVGRVWSGKGREGEGKVCRRGWRVAGDRMRGGALLGRGLGGGFGVGSAWAGVGRGRLRPPWLGRRSRPAPESDGTLGDGGAQRAAGDGRERLGEVGPGGPGRWGRSGGAARGGGGQIRQRSGPAATGGSFPFADEGTEAQGTCSLSPLANLLASGAPGPGPYPRLGLSVCKFRQRL